MDCTYDAFDADGVVQANKACAAFAAFPGRLTVDECSHRIHHLTLGNPSWQARP